MCLRRRRWLRQRSGKDKGQEESGIHGTGKTAQRSRTLQGRMAQRDVEDAGFLIAGLILFEERKEDEITGS